MMASATRSGVTERMGVTGVTAGVMEMDKFTEEVRRQIIRIGEFAAARPVGADEIGVAEAALRLRPVLLAAGPQVAAGKAQEHRAAARLHALALEGEEAFLHGVGHQPASDTAA